MPAAARRLAVDASPATRRCVEVMYDSSVRGADCLLYATARALGTRGLRSAPAKVDSCTSSGGTTCATSRRPMSGYLFMLSAATSATVGSANSTNA